MARQGEKPALQDRARRTRDSLAEAFGRLLAERSFEEIAVADIAREAGVSVGAVYRRFENKDAFVPLIFEIYRTRLADFLGPAGGLEIDAAAGLRPALREICRRAVRFLEAERGVARAAFLYSRLRPDLAGDWSEMIEASRAGFRALAAAFPQDVKRSDLDAAGDALAYFMNVAPADRILFADGTDGLIDKTGDAFADELADFAYGYLTMAED